MTADAGIYEFRNQLGMRTLGASKAAWSVRQHGYTSIVISKLQMVSVEEAVQLCSPYIGPKTIIGIGTTLIAAPISDKQKNGAMGLKRNSHSIINNLQKIVNILRMEHDNIVIVGGAVAESFQRMFDADYAIPGDSEIELPKLMDKIRRAGIQKKPYDWNITTCNYQWHDSDFVQPKEPLPLETARGCIFSCKFCTFDKLGKRKGTFERSVESIREEMISSYQRFGTQYYWLASDTFNDDDDRVNEFCDMIDTLPFKIYFSGFFRLDLLHRYPKTARRLYERGLIGVSLGVETFHPEASKSIGKAFNGKLGKTALEELYYGVFDENVMIGTTNIIGLPGETLDFLNETVEWYRERDFINVSFSALQLHHPDYVEVGVRNTELTQNPGKYGYRFPDINKPFHWETDIMTYDQSVVLNRDIMLGLHNMNNMDPWMGTFYACVTGKSPRELMAMDWRNVVIKHTKDIDKQSRNYFAQLKNS